MKKSLVFILAMSCTVAALVFNAVSKPKPEEKEVKQLAQYMYNAMWWQGKYPPDFELTLLDGSRFRMSDHIGKEVIVLNFFATWCEPCKDEMPELSSYFIKHRAENLTLVGINVNEKKDLVVGFVAEQKLPFPVGIDEDDEIGQQYSVKSYPTTVLIGIDGKIALYEMGSISNAEVVFNPLLKDNQNVLKKHGAIDVATYHQELANQPKPVGDGMVGGTAAIELDSTALKFTERMRCPSTGKKVANCNCDFCRDIKLRLKIMDLKGKKDEQILREIFLMGAKP